MHYIRICCRNDRANAEDLSSSTLIDSPFTLKYNQIKHIHLLQYMLLVCIVYHRLLRIQS